jgi:UDP-2-acetamido-2-deoxy-ribo-hexuluronate aminotransferase
VQFNNILRYPKKVYREINNNISKIIKNGQFILGPEVEKLEKKLSATVKTKYCVGVSSGTDALLISLLSLNIKHNDEVIVPSLSWISTAQVIKILGAKPIFVDIELDTCNIDANLVEKKISKKTRAIIAVSLFGNTPDFNKLNKISNKYKIPIIEDAAQSLGAKYKNKFSCNLTTIGCTSFFPSKTLGSFGDAGAVFTNSSKLYKKIKKIRNQGKFRSGIHDILGVNGRIDTLQCGILLSKLKHFKKELKLREVKYNYYHNFFKKNNFKSIKMLNYSKHGKSAFSQFTILSSNRKAIIEQFKRDKIPYSIYYSRPMHMQKIFNLKYKNFNKKSILVSKKTISIPFSPYITKKEQNKVCKSFLKIRKKI